MAVLVTVQYTVNDQHQSLLWHSKTHYSIVYQVLVHMHRSRTKETPTRHTKNYAENDSLYCDRTTMMNCRIFTNVSLEKHYNFLQMHPLGTTQTRRRGRPHRLRVAQVTSGCIMAFTAIRLQAILLDYGIGISANTVLEPISLLDWRLQVESRRDRKSNWFPKIGLHAQTSLDYFENRMGGFRYLR